MYDCYLNLCCVFFISICDTNGSLNSAQQLRLTLDKDGKKQPFPLVDFAIPVDHNVKTIIIMSRCQHGSPWPSLATRLYCPSLLGAFQVYILHRHRVVSCWSSCRCSFMFLAGRPAFARLCEGVRRSISLLSSSLLLQQCSACLICVTLIVFVMSCSWS